MMKAITLEKYGTPEVLQLTRVPIPKPAPNEVLVRVRAASLNALDKHLSSGIILVRPKMGLLKPNYGILGSDLAGEVVEVGHNVTRFAKGDFVFGGRLWGAFAEYACLVEEKAAKIPEAVSFQEAAALPVAAGTALQGLRFGKLKKGQHVLINGASGGVGIYMVQLAKYFGAHVTAVCSGKNVSLIEALGADEVIDYQTTDIRESDRHFELILDNVGNLSIRDCKQLTTERGTALVVGFSKTSSLLGFLFRAPLVSMFSNKHFSMLDTKVNHQDLEYLAGLVQKGAIKSVIDKEYDLEETRSAMEYLWTRRVRSKLILNI